MVIYETEKIEKSQGDTAVAAGNYLEAALLYSEEIGHQSPKSVSFYKRAKCLMEINNFDLAIRDLTRAIELEPNQVIYHYRMIDCYLKMGDSDKAEEILSSIRGKFTTYSRGVNLKISQIRKLKDFKSHKFDYSSEANVAFLKHLNSEQLKITPACPDYKFLKMRTLVILEKFNEIDDNLNSSKMRDSLFAYYNGNVEKSLRLFPSTPAEQSLAVENFKTEVKSFQEMERGWYFYIVFGYMVIFICRYKINFACTNS